MYSEALLPDAIVLFFSTTSFGCSDMYVLHDYKVLQGLFGASLLLVIYIMLFNDILILITLLRKRILNRGINIGNSIGDTIM